MWKRICAYIVGIPLIFIGLLYGYGWREHRKAVQQVRRLLADEAANYEALDSFDDIDLDPPGLTLGKLEEHFRQPPSIFPGVQNTTIVGWACADKKCAISASFLAPHDRKLDPEATPVAFFIFDSRQIRPHRIAIGGIYMGESKEEARQFCKKRGYGVELGHNQLTWDKHWKVICSGIGEKVDLLVFANQDVFRNRSENKLANPTKD